MGERRFWLALTLGISVALTGCVQQPLGPTVNVMPPPAKPFDLFTQDQAACKQYAGQETAGAAQAANGRAVATALLGTALGAGLGAAVGGRRGTAVGAASGAAVGTAVAAGPAQGDQMTLQDRYDNAFAQCMYARGNLVPGFGPPAMASPPSPVLSAAPPPDLPKPKRKRYEQ